MIYRISIFGKMDRVSNNHILIVVGNRKFNLKHKNIKVIHMLYFCYKKLLIRNSVDFSNKQLGEEIIGYLVQIGFLIPYGKGNRHSSIEEIKMINQVLHNELGLFEPTTNDIELQLLHDKSVSREKYDKKNNIITSPFLEFLLKRESQRDFTSNKLDYNSVLSILQSGLLVDKEKGKLTFHGVTPSAGCFYEIDAFIITFKDIKNLGLGSYKYDKYSNCISKVKIDDKHDVFLSGIRDNFKSINAMIIFTGNIEYITEKYGHKSYLYQSLEVGSIQQNITLFCQQNSLGTCVLGGFNNGAIRSNFNLNDDIIIYSTILI